MEANINNIYWDKITAYYSKDLSEADRRSIEEWAERVDGKDLLMEMNMKMEQVNRASFMYNDKTDKAWDKLNNRILLEKKTQLNFFRNNRSFIGIAASIIILVSIGFGISKMMQNSLNTNTLHTALNQSQVELADGTIVHLNGNSSLEYPNRFKGDLRKVKLTGEAFFDVKPDKDHPFVIEANNAFIKVLGTSFNVRAVSNKSNVEVLVSSGKVSFQKMDDPKQELILVQGDFASLNNDKLQNGIVEDLNYMAWQSKLLYFDHSPLSEVIATLNRAYAVQIILEDEKLGDLELTSKYDRLDVDALLDAMCLTFKLNKRVENDHIILYSITP